MNTDQVKGKFKQLSGEIKRKWGQVTDDDLKQAQGSMEKLIGKIQERSGDRREAIEEWLKRIPVFRLEDPAKVTWSEGTVRGPRALRVAFAAAR